MSLKKNLNKGNSIGNSGNPKNQNPTKRVVDIILSPDHRAYNSPEDIGTIFFVEVGFNQNYNNSTSLPSAKPINRNNFTYPTIGELVQIIESTSNDIYDDLEGDISSTTNYYTPAINIHNNTTSNSLPLENDSRKLSPKREPNVKIFEFKKEFKSPSREIARKQLNNYLTNLGYSAGINDFNAPLYNLTQSANGDYIFRLEESQDNEQVAVKLGKYFKENPELNPLIPGEGDSIMEGKNGQRIRFTTTGPTGTNVISNNVTNIPDDGNPSIGDKAMVLSLGNNSQENITKDAASIYMLENQNIPIDATSTNIDSLNSTYAPLVNPLESVSMKSPIIIPQSSPEQELLIQDIQFDFTTAFDSTPITEITQSTQIIDPVFSALDESQTEGILLYSSSTYSIDEGENIESDQGSNDEDIIYPGTDFVIFNDANYLNTPQNSLYTATARGLGNKGITLDKVIKSQTAIKNGILNFPGVDAKEGYNFTAAKIMSSLDKIITNCIDPILNEYPDLIINSGLRVTQLNNILKGSQTSEHRLGRAIDFKVLGTPTYEIFNYIVNNNIPYNQLIWEFPERGNRSWIHISFHEGNNKFNKTIASKDTSLKRILENNYNGVNFNEGNYARNISINNVPDHTILT